MNDRFGFGKKNVEWGIDIDPRVENNTNEFVDIFNDKKMKNKCKTNKSETKSPLLTLGKELVEMKQIFNDIISELQSIHNDISPDILKAVRNHYMEEKAKLVKKIIREIVNNLM